MQLPSFDEFIEKHGDYLKLMLLEEILSKSPKRISEEEEKKIEKTIEIAIDAAKKLAETYGNPEKLVHAGLMKICYAKDALAVLEFLNPEKHPLDVIGDHIIELKKMHPEVVKPEKVYGKEWYEFLKKKGIDPKTLESIGKKSATPRSKGSRENAEVLKRDGLKVELLSVLKALEYTNYSSEAVEGAIKELERKIIDLSSLSQPSREEVFITGVYALLINYLSSRDFKRAKMPVERLFEKSQE